jgi:membrane protein
VSSRNIADTESASADQAASVASNPEPSLPFSNFRQSDPFANGPVFRVRTLETLWESIWASFRFLFQTEVHVYALAVAANVLLCFFPFLVAIIKLCRYVFHWQAAIQTIMHVVTEYFPAGFGVDFPGYLMQAATHQKFSWLSVFLLLFTANGIFIPLEVALNRIFRVQNNRSFLRNQTVSLGLILGCGALVLGSVSISTLNMQYLSQNMGSSHYAAMLQPVLFKITAPAISILVIFLIYWRLPNARISVKRIIPASVVVGILLEGLKYLDILTWPYLQAKLRVEIPPFVQSVSIILWSFVATLILLAGAEWSARTTMEPRAVGEESPSSVVQSNQTN